MSIRKERLTVTVDPDLIAAGNDAVSEGRAESLSAWVNSALAEKLTRERRLTALAEAVATYEARFGAISLQELDEQRRADRHAAVVVRGNKTRPVKRRSRRGTTR
jgi:Arc/MetJ-type ribon-helix-helix transcriptional regulator